MSKQQIRQSIRKVLAQLQDEYIHAQSEAIAMHLFETTVYKRSSAVSVYLPMKKEVNTHFLIERLFADEKRVYVPKVTGSGREDMVHVHIRSVEDIAAFPKNQWGIPEPPDTYGTESTDAEALENIDLVLVPGMAFTRAKKRLGHGKGYYDTFFEKIQGTKKELSKEPAVLLGLSLSETLLEDIPVEDHDFVLSGVIVPDGLLSDD